MQYKLYPFRKYWLPLSRADFTLLEREAAEEVRFDTEESSRIDPDDAPDENHHNCSSAEEDREEYITVLQTSLKGRYLNMMMMRL
jgi:hypothetical protein